MAAAPLILLLLKSTTYGSTLSEVLAEAHTWFLRDRLRFLGPDGLGSGLIDHSQKMTVAAMQMADMKVCAHRS